MTPMLKSCVMQKIRIIIWRCLISSCFHDISLFTSFSTAILFCHDWMVFTGKLAFSNLIEGLLLKKSRESFSLITHVKAHLHRVPFLLAGKIWYLENKTAFQGQKTCNRCAEYWKTAAKIFHKHCSISAMQEQLFCPVDGPIGTFSAVRVVKSRVNGPLLNFFMCRFSGLQQKPILAHSEMN